MCEVLEVSRSGFYRWLGRRVDVREAFRAEVLSQVRQVHAESHRSYGAPRIERELRARGYRHGRRFIGELMRRNGLRGLAARKRRPRSQPSGRSIRIDNVLQRRFYTPVRNRVWMADITYVPTREGWLYLAVVVDLASRRVVGWATSRRADIRLTLRALEMAMALRRPARGLLHHSDRGVQYSCPTYLQRLSSLGIEASLSRTGDCWDNAVVESFFHTLKVERVRACPRYVTRNQATRDIAWFIDGWYNQKRRHSSLGYLSPAEFERRL